MSKKLKISGALAALTALVGVVLMIYMIIADGEPGALPLFLIAIGMVWFTVNQFQKRKNNKWAL